MDIIFIIEAAVVLGAIVMGTRAGGVGVGMWGGLGTAVLVFVFGEAPGEPPGAAMLIILAVVTAAALMQAAGGIDWMVQVAAKIIRAHPKQITLIAPLTAFAFSIGAGTSNILYPLLPVIYDVSYQNNIRPSRPLSVSVAQSGMALAASPVSAAMAAMLALTDVAPFNCDLVQILSITIPACIAGIVVSAFAANRMGKELDQDPEVKARIAAGELPPPGLGAVAPTPPLQAQTSLQTETPLTAAAASTVGGSEPSTIVPASSTPPSPPAPPPSLLSGNGTPGGPGELTSTARGRNSAIVFLLGVVLIVILGLFPDLRPAFEVDGVAEPLSMTATIALVMFGVGVVILAVGRPKVGEVPGTPVFKSGMVSAIALLGIAWLTATFIAAHEEFIVSSIGAWVNDWRFIFALAVFLVAALTTSQSTATNTIVPIGLAAGLAPALVTGMWAGALGGVYTLPANGTQIAAANFDLSGTTKLGTKLLDHSFFIPMLVMSATAIAVGALLAVILY
jgi:anaerobic C4-dicarboxylate transporter DcuB